MIKVVKMRSLLLVNLIFLVVQTARIDAQGEQNYIDRFHHFYLYLLTSNVLKRSILGTIYGRLLTPTEGCGYPPRKTTTRIVGGSTAKQGTNRKFKKSLKTQ